MREHLLSAWEQSGRKPDELANALPCPQQAAHLWAYFLELDRGRGNNGFGPSPLRFVDIEAWSRLTMRALDLWELNAILRLDAAFMLQRAKDNKQG